MRHAVTVTDMCHRRGEAGVVTIKWGARIFYQNYTTKLVPSAAEQGPPHYEYVCSRGVYKFVQGFETLEVA